MNYTEKCIDYSFKVFLKKNVFYFNLALISCLFIMLNSLNIVELKNFVINTYSFILLFCGFFVFTDIISIIKNPVNYLNKHSEKHIPEKYRKEYVEFVKEYK